LEPGVIVDFSPGVRSHTRIPLAPAALLHLPDGTEPGVLVEFAAEDGTVLGTQHRLGGSCTWRSLPATVRSAGLAVVRLTTSVRARTSGAHVIGCSGHGRLRLTLAGDLAFDTYLSVPGGTDPTDAHIRPPQHFAPANLEARQFVRVVLEHHVGSSGGPTSFVLGGVSFQLNIEEPYRPDDEEITHAVGLAQAADMAVVVVGTTGETESEGFDRATLDLPGRQDELVRRVAAANPRTVMVVDTGAPVFLPWDTIPAVLLTLFPGQEYGNALADVLLGRSEPGGRLPVTWPESVEDLPTTRPEDEVLVYTEGLNIGYRHFDRAGREPRYPFGHGLGYTRWEYLAADVVTPASGAGAEAIVRVRLRNAGSRQGCETIQVYASRPDSTVERPVRWLAGFAKAEAPPGTDVLADVIVPLRCLAYWDTAARTWAIEPGDFQLHIGRSSRDLPLQVTITASFGTVLPVGPAGGGRC
jgi:beta-glucosidase